MKRLQDFLIWLGDVADGFSAPKPPAKALAMQGGAPVLLRYQTSGYVTERPAQTGDKAPLHLSEDEALTTAFDVAGEAALHGAGAARIEAARRCPFPLEEAAWSLTRRPASWESGAPWTLAATPDAKLAAIRDAVTKAGGAPGDAFTMIDGAPVTLSKTGKARAAPLLPLAALFALVCALGAAAAVEFRANALEAAAQDRLTEARRALSLAETEASVAAAAREAAASPIRAALAGDALFAAAPQAGAALAALTKATPDEAHMRRASITPGAISGEFIAPDAAALARTLAAASDFSAAALGGAARTDAQTGLQRAVLDIRLESDAP